MIILNEREYAEKCLREKPVVDKPFENISIIARYYYWVCGYRKKKIYSLLLEYLKETYPRYELNEMYWLEILEKVAQKAKSYNLLETSGVRITKSEMETIRSIGKKVYERLAFTFLCLAKLNNLKNPNNHSWVFQSRKEIYDCARISCSTAEQDWKIGYLADIGLLKMAERIDNLNLQVTFIDEDDEVELFVSDFRELGYEYLKYCGENYIRCEECGILIKGNKNGTKKYCKNCAGFTPIVTKKVVCIDCGQTFVVNSKNTKSVRCPACHAEYSKVHRREMKRLRRAKEKDGSLANKR